jgi:hypothetical protein
MWHTADNAATHNLKLVLQMVCCRTNCDIYSANAMMYQYTAEHAIPCNFKRRTSPCASNQVLHTCFALLQHPHSTQQQCAEKLYSNSTATVHVHNSTALSTPYCLECLHASKPGTSAELQFLSCNTVHCSLRCVAGDTTRPLTLYFVAAAAVPDTIHASCCHSRNSLSSCHTAAHYM